MIPIVQMSDSLSRSETLTLRKKNLAGENNHIDPKQLRSNLKGKSIKVVILFVAILNRQTGVF